MTKKLSLREYLKKESLVLIKEISRLILIIGPPAILVSLVALPFGSSKLYSGTVILTKVLSGSTILTEASINGDQLGKNLIFPNPQIKVDKELSEMLKLPEKYFEINFCATTTSNYKLGLLKNAKQDVDNIHFSVFKGKQRTDLKPNDRQCFDSSGSIIYSIGDIGFDMDKSRADIEKMGYLNDKGQKELVSSLTLKLTGEMKYPSVVILLYLISFPYCWSWIKRIQEMRVFVKDSPQKINRKIA